MKILFFSLMLIWLFVLSNSFGQQIIYVRADGKVNASGDKNNPVATIVEAYDKINSTALEVTDNVEIRLMYEKGPIKLGETHGTEAPCRTALIWTKSGGDNHTILLTSDTYQATVIRNTFSEITNKPLDQMWWSFIEFINVQNITVRNILFENAAGGIFLSRGTKKCKVDKCTFKTHDFYGIGGGGSILLQGDEKNTIYCEGNSITNNTIIFDEPTIYDIGYKNEDINQELNFSLYHGIYLSAYTKGNIIENNTIENAPGGGIHLYHYNIQGNLIRYNKIWQCYCRDYKLKTEFISEAPIYFSNLNNRSLDKQKWGIIMGYDQISQKSTIYGNIIISNTILTNNVSNPNAFKIYDGLKDINLSNLENNTIIPIICNSSSSDNATLYNERFNKRFNTDRDVKLYNFGDVSFVSINIIEGTNKTSKLLKIKDTGTSGYNLFNISGYTNGEYNGDPNWLLGSEYFDGRLITDIEFIDGNTLIAFDDGWILKILGTGGSMSHMFNIKKDCSNCWWTDYSKTEISYLKGQDQFAGGVKDIYYIPLLNKSFIICNKIPNQNNNTIYKITSSGGEGTSMFTGYKEGWDNSFSSNISCIKYVNGVVFLCFENGKILKDNGTGGISSCMFAVNETPTGFTKMVEWDYYLGHQFSTYGYVTNISSNNQGQLLFCFSDGKILKTSIGGFGSNMFAITETYDRFTGLSHENGTPYGYYIGDQKYNGYVTSGFYDSATDNTVLGFSDGNVRVIRSFGTSGSYVFNNVLDTIKNTDGSKSLKIRMLNTFGWEKFVSKVTDIDYINGNLLISMVNGKIIKISSLLGLADPNPTSQFYNYLVSKSGYSFIFGIYETIGSGYICDCFRNSYIGHQDLFFDSSRTKSVKNANTIVPENKNEKENIIKVFPNPSFGSFYIFVESNDEKLEYDVQVFSLNGLKIIEKHNVNETIFALDLTKWHKGMYLLKVSIGNRIITEKLIVK